MLNRSGGCEIVPVVCVHRRCANSDNNGFKNNKPSMLQFLHIFKNSMKEQKLKVLLGLQKGALLSSSKTRGNQSRMQKAKHGAKQRGQRRSIYICVAPSPLPALTDRPWVFRGAILVG